MPRSIGRRKSVTPKADPAAEGVGTSLKLWVTLTRAQAALAAHAEGDIKRDGLTIGEFAVLELLYHKGRTLLGEIQRKVLVSSGGITFLVDRLVKKGLLERQTCPGDRRARYAALTAEGENVIRRMFPRHASHMAAAMGALTLEEQRQLTVLTKRLGLGAVARQDSSVPPSKRRKTNRRFA